MPAQKDTAKTLSLEAWKSRRNHVITLPSSAQVEIQIPDLPHLLKTGAIPNELIDTAIGVAQGKKISRDDILAQSEFYDRLIVITVVNPPVTEADVRELPFEDREMIVDLATRQRDLDALGHHIGGLEKVKDFRKFRGLTTGDEDDFSI